MKKSFALMIIIMLLFSVGRFPISSIAEAENTISLLTDKQRNSVGVLNYMAYLTMEIHNQKSNRLYLEKAYSSLYNNTYMNAIDAVTLGQVKSLLTALNNFKMLTVKRERLEYIYEQNQAQAIKSVIPSPMDILNVVQSGSWQKMLVSVARMAVDSVASYNASRQAADMGYLQDGWALDDEEAEILHRGHLDSLEYMWEIIHDYDLPSDLAITEDDINRFVAWKSDNNLVGRIQFLESNREVYQAFGEYWLELAESYYAHGDMAKCLDAVKCYETYSTRIFRKDYHYAEVLSMAIAAAKEVYDDGQYVTEAARFAEGIIANCDQENWVLRYFAAVTYVELASRTSNIDFLQKAYNIVLNNVNYLVPKQKKNNNVYLAAIEPVDVPAGATKAKKTEIDAFNKGLQEARKTAVPPVSDALMVNCDLLFSLADQLDVGEEEMMLINGILHGDEKTLFINPYIDNLYQAEGVPQIDLSQIDISFDGEKIKIPARYLTENTVISVGGLDTKGKIFIIDDWRLESVNRKNGADVESFIATFISDMADDLNYEVGSTVWINFNPAGDDHTPDFQISFSVVSETDFIFSHTDFQRVN